MGLFLSSVLSNKIKMRGIKIPFLRRSIIYHQVDVRKIKPIKYKLLMNSSYRGKLNAVFTDHP